MAQSTWVSWFKFVHLNLGASSFDGKEKTETGAATPHVNLQCAHATHYNFINNKDTSTMNLTRCFTAYLLVLSSSAASANVYDIVPSSSYVGKEQPDWTNDLLASATLASTTLIIKRPKLKNRKLVRRRRQQEAEGENARYHVSNQVMESMITPPHIVTTLNANNINNIHEEQEDRQLVVGGAEAVEDRHYYMVSLQYNGQHFCGGSLIARNVILTAAHCGTYDPIYAILGRHDLKHDTDGQKIGIRTKVIHPKYDKLETDNDFMLLFLEKPYNEASNVGIVKLNKDDAYPLAGERVADMGWGDTTKDEGIHVASETLQRVYLEVLSNVDCDKSEGYYLDGTRGWTYGSCQDFITDNMLCTYKKDRGSCSGDSGGPLVVKPDISDGAQDVQVGVSSWMIDCAGNFPGVYARVSKGYAWIESEICARSNEYACEAGFACGNCDENGGIIVPVRTSDNTGERIGTKPCPVCVDGLTVDPTTIIPYPEANGASCAHLMKFATAGVTKAVCNSMFQAETICCPILATNPCSACPDGITVDESVLVHPTSTKTCGDLVVDSMISEEESEICNRMKKFKSVCCPYVNPNDRTANLYDDEWMTLDDDKWRL